MILIDTHVVIWMMSSPGRISRRASEAIASEGGRDGLLYISAASVYELSYAGSRGRVQIRVPSAQLVKKLRAWSRILPVTGEIAVQAGAFSESSFHGDPIDRIIAATAMIENCLLITCDERIRQANVCRTLW